MNSPKHQTMLILRITILLFGLMACVGKEGKNSSADKRSAFEKKLATLSQKDFDTSYARICRNLDLNRKAIGERWKKAGNESEKEKAVSDARELLLTSMADSVFVCWYGTGWDFNGTTTAPRKGNIACGYFITTTLQQSGFNIQRSWLAQQASSVMIGKLCAKDKIKIITNNQTQKLFDYIRNQPDGIFIIGLDNHTGFIVKKEGKTSFVHSNYLASTDKVVSEPLDKSKIILQNNYFVVGNLSQSNETITKWICGETIGE